MSSADILLIIWLVGCIIVTICFAKWWREDSQLVSFAKISPETFALTAIVAVVTWPLGLIWILIEENS